MYLGIINGWEDGHIKAVHDKGLKWVEFCLNHNYDSAEVLAQADRIAESCKKYDVRVGSIGRWGMTRLNEKGEPIPEALAHDRNCIDLASKLGCPVFNLGVNPVEGFTFMQNCDAAIKYLTLILDYAKYKNVKIGIYNCDWANFIYDDKSWSVVLGRLPELGIKYDTSHCMGRCGDYMAEIDKWGDRFYHVHIKGSLYVGGRRYDDPPAGLDDVNWGAVMAMLYIKKYNGMLSIEPHSHNWRGTVGQWGIEYTIRHITPMVMPEDYECSDDPYLP